MATIGMRSKVSNKNYLAAVYTALSKGRLLLFLCQIEFSSLN